MRIVAGQFKGSILNFSSDKTTRPLKDRAREGIFNVLNHSNKLNFILEKSKILDLYAGIGSFGIECISRNAQKVCFVENNKKVLKILKKNIKKLNLEKKTNIFNDDVITLIKKKNFFKIKFDLIFCDPPFKDKNLDELIRYIVEAKLINKDGILIIHRNNKIEEKFSSLLKIIDEKNYGISKIIFAKILL